jgi:limonene-1,2-epoxide hydrolase
LPRTEPERVVERLWRALDERDFEGAGRLVHEDCVFEWPQSRERIRGRTNVVALNAHYPGEWSIRIERIVSAGGLVVSQVYIEHSQQDTWAISFFEIEDGLIRRATEFWPEPAEPLPGRERWVERF